MSKKEEKYYKETPILTKSWSKSHIKKWGKEVLNKENNKENIVKKIKSIDESKIDNIDDFEINPFIGNRALEIFCMYYSYKMEATIKRAFLNMVMDGRKTLKEDDLMKAFFQMDMGIDQGMTIGTPLENDIKSLADCYESDENEKSD